MSSPPAPPAQVARRETLPLRAQDAWELLIDVEAQQQWLGRGSAIPREGNVQLATDAVAWRHGVVLPTDHTAMTKKISLAAGPGWAQPVPTLVELRIEPHPERPRERSRLFVTEEPIEGATLTSEAHRDIEEFWSGAIGRLHALARAIGGRRTPVQAVVVVHGIGEQLPGKTLSGFVDAVITDSGKQFVKSKPDRISQSLELRRLSITESRTRPKTDFYELYWAHQIGDTTPGQVVGWVGRLLNSRRRDVPPALRPAWITGRIAALLFLVALGVMIVSVARTQGALALLGAVSLVLSSTLTVVSFLLVKSLGDAARYLSARPANVDARERIRRQGMELLDRLHQSGRYSRIVVVGHSLGSVIAYDVMTHLWADMAHDHLRPRKTLNKRNGELHRYQGSDPDEAQALQHRAWAEIRRNTQPWLITDLITVGSPLTHAQFLMTTGTNASGRKVERAAEWAELLRRREVAGCPPVRDEELKPGTPAFAYQANFTNRDGYTRKTFRYLHHAAPFAVVRWTNLYFPAKLTLFGDPIGGPLRPTFGDWVRDVHLRPPDDWSRMRRMWLHSSYWKGAAGDDGQDAATPLAWMRRALDLHVLKELADENREHPPIMYLREPEL